MCVVPERDGYAGAEHDEELGVQQHQQVEPSWCGCSCWWILLEKFLSMSSLVPIFLHYFYNARGTNIFLSFSSSVSAFFLQNILRPIGLLQF